MKSAFVAFVLVASLFGIAQAAEKPTLAIHMISGAREYKSEECIKTLKKILEEKYRVSITASWAHDGAKELGGIEHLPKADLLVVYARRMKLSQRHMAIVRKHWESGKPIVGIRTASHAFSREENEIFDRKVMGGNYQGHFGSEPVKVRAVDKGRDHPVLKGVGAIESKRLYKTGPLAEHAVLLQNGTIEAKKTTHAVTWVHEYKGGRTFYTSLGVPNDFTDDDFLRMIVNAVFWTSKRDAADYRKTD